MSMIDKLATRVKLFLVKALLKAVDDSGDMQLVKLSGLAGETIDGVERMQPYGIASVPPLDSEVLAASIQGNRDHVIAIVTDNSDNRPHNLSTNDVVFYSAHGQKILMKSSGDIQTDSGSFIVNNGSDFVAMAQKVDNIITKIDTVFRSWAVAPQDGGGALKAQYMAQFPGPPQSVASTDLKAD